MKLSWYSHILILYFLLSFLESIILTPLFWILDSKSDISTKSDILIFQRILTGIYCSRIHANQPDCNHCIQKFAWDFPWHAAFLLHFVVIPTYDCKTLDRHICCKCLYRDMSEHYLIDIMIRMIEMHRCICAMKCLLLWKNCSSDWRKGKFELRYWKDPISGDYGTNSFFYHMY